MNVGKPALGFSLSLAAIESASVAMRLKSAENAVASSAERVCSSAVVGGWAF